MDHLSVPCNEGGSWKLLKQLNWRIVWAKNRYDCLYSLGQVLGLQCMRSLQRKLPHGTSGLYKQPSVLHLHYLPGPHLADLAHCSPPVIAAGWPGTLRIAVAAAWPEGQLPGHQYSVPTAVASRRSSPFVIGCVTVAYSRSCQSRSVLSSQPQEAAGWSLRTLLGLLVVYSTLLSTTGRPCG